MSAATGPGEALLQDLRELDRAGALDGVRAVIADRLCLVRQGRPGPDRDPASWARELLGDPADHAGRLALAAALLAAQIDLAVVDSRDTRTGQHQEGERREDPCGCQHIWCRGRWYPSGLVCGQHWPDDPEAAAIMRRGPDE